jgi:hypothetical protein
MNDNGKGTELVSDAEISYSKASDCTVSGTTAYGSNTQGQDA